MSPEAVPRGGRLAYEEFVVELSWRDEDRLEARHGELTETSSTAALRTAVSPHRAAQADEQARSSIGGLVGALLLPASIGTAFDDAWERISTDPAAGLRLVIALPRPRSDALDLGGIPWEAVRHRSERPLAVREKTSVVRRWIGQRTTDELFDDEPRSIQVFQATNIPGQELDADFPNVEPHEWRILGRLRIVRDPVLSDVESLSDERISVFHFTGHGEAHALRLAERDITRPMASAALVGTRLAVLSACDTSTNEPRALFPHPGIAGELADTVPAVLGMSRQVKDTETSMFHGEMYRLLRAGVSLDEAVRSARSLLMDRSEPGRLAWAVPVLHLGVTGSTRPRLRGAPPVQTAPLAVLRSRDGRTIVAVEASEGGGARLVPLEDAAESPAALSPDGSAVATGSGSGLVLGHVYSDGDRVGLEQWAAGLPDALADAHVLAVSRRYASSTLDLVLSGRTGAVELSWRSGWIAPQPTNGADGASGAVFTPAGTLLVRDRRLVTVPDLLPGFLSMARVSGCDVGCSAGVWIAVAWGSDRAGRPRLEVHRWDERHEAGGEPYWSPVEIPYSLVHGAVSAGVVRELSSREAPHQIVVQKAESIESFDLLDSRADTLWTR
ncbi:CHAT domain-containing protein [Rathayibacter sp. Leaf296]|uniref:CHAT domain-containing protein n=1 Tax=Rathayibacter sp. Leaf296 TaxID=1736327 RepID=UPI000702D755|nr:CHAT domain-containing protein [Rathayibacter sp. Leaf296]KQQ07567.1 hypothetical protein ASF46_18180 [Rathayibacter sp. Leaf296]